MTDRRIAGRRKVSGLIAELQRRNVIRIAVLYVIASWVVLQVADVGVTLLGLPTWTGRLVLLLLAIGFPLALVGSWLFELTPEGLRREREVPRDDSVQHLTGRRINLLIGLMAALAIVVVVADRLIPRAAPVAAAVAVASVKRVAAPARDSSQSVAVLPFVNMSEDISNLYFSEGLSEELINLLARLPNLRVIGRTSSFQFKGRQEDVRTIGRTLGVANVLEGSVRKAGDRLRVNAQLINTADGAELWSGSYERNLGDAITLQDDIAGEVVKSLRIELLEPKARPRNAPSDPQAYALTLKGRYFLRRSTRQDLQRALHAYREAIQLAPEYSPAWAGLAAVFYAQTNYDHLPVAIGLKAMRAAVTRALSLDPDLAAGHYMLASIQMSYDWDWAAAKQSNERAHALIPGDPAVIRQSGTLKMLAGQFDAAIALYRQSLDLDPLEPNTLNNLAIAQYYAGDLQDAESSIGKLIELNPQSDGAAYLSGLVALARGRPQQALAAFEREPGDVWKLQGRVLAYHAMKQPGASDAALSELAERFASDSAFQIAEAHAFRGERDAAFAWLDRAYAQRDGGLSEIKGDPLLRSLEGDPRHAAFLRRMRL